jgi:cystathionine beta-lyase
MTRHILPYNPRQNKNKENTMTVQYNFDQIINRRTSESVKWRHYAEDVLPMWVADMDFISPEPVIRVLRERVEHGVFGYPDEGISISGNIPPLSQTIIERMSNLYHWQIEPEDVILLPGVVTGFNLACHALANPDQAVLVQTPVYPPILCVARQTGILPQEMELIRNTDGTYTIDRDLFEKSISSQTRLFILCNPHNPIGKVYNPDELLDMAQTCLRHGVTICSDEIHCDLIYRGQHHTPIASLDPEIAQNTITLIAPSKTYNIPGLQCSIAIIQNRELRKCYLRAKKGLVPWVNLMGLLAAQAAYQEGQEWLQQALFYLEGNRDYLYQYIREQMQGIEMSVPAATYLGWLDCREVKIPGNPYKFFLEKGRVAFNDGEDFGKGGEGFIRLNFGCPRSVLMDGLERMKKALQFL